MKKVFAAILLLAFPQILIAQTDEGYKQLFRDKITIEKSGTSIAAVFVDEKGTRFVNFGTLTKDAASEAANAKTVYEIGSITKLFVGVLLADAVKRGEVKLDAPISLYLPKTVKGPTFNGKEITLLDLATHTSALPRLPDNLAPKDNLDPYADYTALKLYDFLSGYKLTREIGSEYEYSNLGVGLLGHILSLRSKMPFEQLMMKRIFAPLGMNDTSLSLVSSRLTKHAQGYNAENKPTPIWTFDALAGAGAIRTTSADMAKFIAASVGIEKTPLAEAFTDARKMYRQGQNSQVKVGLCWNNADLFGTEVFWHGGGTYGFSSYIAIEPKQKRGAFLVNNAGQPTGSVFLESVAFNYLQPKFPIKKSEPARTEISLSKEILATYVGEYLVAEGLSIFITLEGSQLYGRATGQDRFELFSEKEDKFFAKVAGITIAFEKGNDGKVSQLKISQAGNDTPAKKIK